MIIVFLIISCLLMVLAFSLLAAAVCTSATYDQKPLDLKTHKMLMLSTWPGDSSLVYGFVVTRHWRQCQQGRYFFYTGLASGVVSVVCILLATQLG